MNGVYKINIIKQKKVLINVKLLFISDIARSTVKNSEVDTYMSNIVALIDIEL